MRTKINRFVGTLAMLFVPVLAFFLMECYGHNPLEEVRQKAIWFNIFLFELIAWLLFFVLGRARMALRIELVIAMLYGLANAYVVQFRTNPIVPWDLFSIQTAASVVSNYDFTPSKHMLLVTGGFLVLIAVLQLVNYRLPLLQLREETFDWRENGKKLLIRFVPAVFIVTALVNFVGKLQDSDFQTKNYLYPYLFTPVYMTDVNGMAVTFAMNLAYMSIDEPKGYNRDEVEAVLSGYEEQNNVAEEVNRPNIIVIMNEAFSDMDSVAEFTTNEDYMPFIHSLQKGAQNTISGDLQVSICGGNTANSEFEFLTGYSMAFLPQGSIPYQQYINEEIPSLPSYLQKLGYQTIATHPYHATGWERNTIYPLLGFERSIFIDEYNKRTKLRSYISDKACVDKIIELYEKKDEKTPLFVFNVTMQNHGGYDEEFTNFSPDIIVEGLDSIVVEQYLSLVKVSDAEFERLVNYFSQVKEDTMIVFFGDHQPNDAVAGPLVKLNGKSIKNFTDEELLTRYEVPYVIWANFDIEEEQDDCTSLNYLGAKVLETAGITPSAYQQFLLELEETYPVISALQIQDKNGNVSNIQHEDVNLRMYKSIQYYYLFDQR